MFVLKMNTEDELVTLLRNLSFPIIASKRMISKIYFAMFNLAIVYVCGGGGGGGGHGLKGISDISVHKIDTDYMKHIMV